LRLEMAPALDLSLAALIRKPFEIFPYRPPGGRALLREFLSDEWVIWHAPLKRTPQRQAIRHSQG